MACCDFQISENRRCGSYAFNLWQEGIEQKYCDRHHWQDEATRLRAELQSMTDDRDSWEKQASDRTDAARAAQGAK
jgi:hypothetical protein